MKTVRISEQQRRVYQMLREGAAQSLVCKRTGLPKGTVSKIASKLVREGYLSRVTKTRPYLYGDGPNAKELDKIIVVKQVSASTSDEVSNHATGVTQVSPGNFVHRTVNGHHVKVRFKVEKLGDTEEIRVRCGDGSTVSYPFLEKRPYLERNGVKRTKGKLHCPPGVLSVELEERPSGELWFYVHLPELKLTREQIQSGEWKEAYKVMGQEAGNWVQRHAGWKLGLIEFTDWKPHFATEDPRILNTIVGTFTAKNHDGSVWTSDSEGKRELETSRPELASVICDLPGAVYELKLTVGEILQVLEMMVAAESRVAEVEALRLQRETNELGLNGIGR
ncbi:MAG: winged helix-turn-helix domain-containing protein [Thermoplasmata archaeon]